MSRRSFSGPIIVVILVALAVGGVILNATFYTKMTPRFVEDLAAGPGPRLAAFLGLLRANKSYGRARDYVTDARDNAHGAAYAQTRIARRREETGASETESETWHVVRGARDRGDAPLLSDLFVFAESGELRQIFPRAAVFFLERSEGDDHLGRLVVAQAGERRGEVSLVVLGEPDAAVFPLPVRLETADGVVHLAPSTSLASTPSTTPDAPSEMNAPPGTFTVDSGGEQAPSLRYEVDSRRWVKS